MVACRSWTWTRFSDGGEAEFVGRAIDRAALDAAAGQPAGEAVVIVIAAVEAAGQFARRGVRPNSPPQITSVLSNRPRCFRSVQEGGDRLIPLLRPAGDGWLRGRRDCPTAGRRRSRPERNARRFPAVAA